MMATGCGRASARGLARKRKVERGGQRKDQAMKGAMDGEFESLVTDLHEGAKTVLKDAGLIGNSIETFNVPTPICSKKN